MKRKINIALTFLKLQINAHVVPLAVAPLHGNEMSVMYIFFACNGAPLCPNERIDQKRWS